MSDQSQTPNNSNSPSGPTPSEGSEQEPRQSLRDTIEQAYDGPEESDAGQEGRARDNYGRFVAKDRDGPGEAEPKAPSPERPITEAQKPPTDPAPEGSSNQVPQHWSAEVRADFEKLPPEGKAILLKRHSEMEADYTRKSQAMSGAVNFTNSLAPVFNDPEISGSLQRDGLNAVQAIQEWAGFHKRAMNPDVRERINLLVDLSQRMGLDPARLFASQQPSPPPNLSPEDMADPAIQYFANQLGRTSGDLAALRAELQSMRQAEKQQRDQESLDGNRWAIDQFADEKDSSGKPLRPYFDAVLEDIVDMFKANPERNLQEAYNKAVWSNEAVRQHMLSAQSMQAQNQNSVDRARAAARSNTRGITSPVAKPSAKTGNGSLRDLLEKTADEVGF